MGDLQAKWQPILKDASRRKVEAVIEEIAGDLAPLVAQDHSRGPSLGVGYAGIALFFHYLGQSRPDTSYSDLAQRFLEKAFDFVQTSDLGFDLYGGISGIAWVHEHLFGPQADDDAMEAVDQALLQLLAVNPWPGLYDLIGGLAGMGVYALEHWPRGRSAEVLQEVAHQLTAALEPAKDGMACFTPPGLMHPSEQEKSPRGHFNVGVAHGMPAVAVVLAAAGRLGPGGDEALAASRKVASWILSCRLDGGDGPIFPRSIAPDGSKTPTRLAWCYGDAGVAGALLATAQALGDAPLADQACAIARRAAGLAFDVCGVVDAPFCHGAAGLTHIFNRFFQATGEDVFRQASEFWLGRLLSYRQPGKGFGGFQANSLEGWLDEPGFLIGSSGIGLVLLALVDDLQPGWDRVLALTTPGS